MGQGHSGASALGGPRLGQQPWSGGVAGWSEEETLSALREEGLRARRVCGWRAGDSLESRGDLWGSGRHMKGLRFWEGASCSLGFQRS